MPGSSANLRPRRDPWTTPSSGPASASATTSFGTPRPLGGPLETEDANTVASTSPSAPITGPPELPFRTSPRNGVITPLDRPTAV